MKKILVLVLLLSNVLLNAQNNDYLWQISGGVNAIIFRHPEEIQDNLLDFNNANMGNHIMLSRHLYKGISPEVSFLIGDVAKYPYLNSPKTLLINGIFNLKYSFSNDYILSSSSLIEPFVKGGIGQTYRNVHGNKYFTTFDFGGGLAIWFNKNKRLGIQIQEIYNVVPSVKYNDEDYFNHSLSVSYRFGMKDRDGDGVRDEKDACPEVAGLKYFNGCPDNDKDCIVDTEDKCPCESGFLEMKGCPDTDGDKIADFEDQCPKVKGVVSAIGCPDTDLDGITDAEDRCPTVKGVIAFSGCPDTDGDGIADIYDHCPEVAGLNYLIGCPDRDLDSVSDLVDQCPDVKGLVQHNGCPAPKEMTRTNLMAQSSVSNVDLNKLFLSRLVYFESSKFQFLKESYAVMDEIVEVFKSPDFKEAYIVEGHADKSGNVKQNYLLSKRRALKVKAYLISKGVPANKLHAIYSGDEFPIADNTYPEGRAKNRRVEIYIKKMDKFIKF